MSFLSNLTIGFLTSLVIVAVVNTMLKTRTPAAELLQAGRGSRVKQEATISIQGQFHQIWGECIGTLERIDVENIALDTDRGLIAGETRRSMKSWGEILTVQIKVVSANECAVHVKSDCKMTTTLFDYGKNASNVRLFLQELSR
jgi:hypothetical protein